MAEIKKIELPATGAHLLPLMSDPSLLLKDSLPSLVVAQMTPIVRGLQTEARCQIPMTQEAAIRLALLILGHAKAMGWPLPEHNPTRTTIQ